MKTLTNKSVAALVALVLSSGMAFAANSNNKRLVNAYGEPVGFGTAPEIQADGSGSGGTPNFSASNPGAGGMYLRAWVNDSSRFESLGVRQERAAAEAALGNVSIGTIEILDSGPTGPMTSEQTDAAKEEVTAQVLNRIKATDRTMSYLKSRAKGTDSDTQARFKVAATEVAERRAALRESLKTVRAADEAQFSTARAAVATNFNDYVAAQHRAEAIVPATQQPAE